MVACFRVKDLLKIDDVALRLSEAGVTIRNKHTSIGVITGVTDRDLSELLAVEGVLEVEGAFYG